MDDPAVVYKHDQWQINNVIISDMFYSHPCVRFEVSFWYPGEPNQSAGEEDCLAFYTRYHFAWNDEHCNKPMPYICEIE